jgi:hypothetical protein
VGTDNNNVNSVGLQKREIKIQRNPHYPGEIFFVESPTQLTLLERKARNRSRHQIVEEESDNDYDSYLSSSKSEDESLIEKVDDDEEDLVPENFDEDYRDLIERMNALKNFLPKYQIS